ncbi:sugar ABC transporter substrate-binding protein [Oscillospiraceae bacterium PP1C4]
MNLKVKRVMAAVLSAAMLMTMFAGCGGATSTTPSAAASTQSAPAASAPAAPETSKKLVVYSQKTLDHYFHVALQESIKRAVEGKGYLFEAAVCNFDSALQTNQFLNFIPKKPIAIIANPVDSDSLIDAVGQANAAGIPVGVVDNQITGGNVGITVTFDNVKAGEMAAEEIVKLLKKKYGEEKGTVINVYGAMSSEAWRLRKEGFEAVINKYPNITYVATPGEGDMGKTQDALTNAIAQYGTIDAVHCPSDSPGRGMIEALKLANMWKKVGEEGHVINVCIDGEPVAIENIEAGYFDASIVQDALAYGPVALAVIEAYVLAGKEIPTSGEYTNEDYYWKTAKFSTTKSGPSLVIPPYVADASNISDPRHWGKIAVKDWGLTYN